jgi:histidyl-tRNA synthetase
VIVGQEYREHRQIVVKDMAGGAQETVDVEQFIAGLGR